jgi:hypothetical protein
VPQSVQYGVYHSYEIPSIDGVAFEENFRGYTVVVSVVLDPERIPVDVSSRAWQTVWFLLLLLLLLFLVHPHHVVVGGGGDGGTDGG